MTSPSLFFRPSHRPVQVSRGRLSRLMLAVSALLASSALWATDHDLPLPTHEDARLSVAYTSDRIWNGMAIAPSGATFFIFTGGDTAGIKVARQLPGGDRLPFPDAAWNSWKQGGDASHAFVHTNAVRIGPEGDVWVLDSGSVGPGHPAIEGAARLFHYAPDSGKLIREYPLNAAVHTDSFVDDFRFNGDHVYMTDAGHGAIIVLDLKTGVVRRVLEGHVSVDEQVPIRAAHHGIGDARRIPHTVQVDQLEVSPDGAYLYYQPLSGKMYRLATRWIDDPAITEKALEAHVETWFNSPSTGGTAMDAAGNIYLSDANNQRILRISPQRKVTTLLSDPRLQWPDAMWLDKNGNLFIPATQTNLTPNFDYGRNEVKYPVSMLKMHLDAKPAANDHP
ncbi:L-dopachrome tautomerase-related protein [Frateuria aurantia]